MKNDISQEEFEFTLMLLGFVEGVDPDIDDSESKFWDRLPDLDVWYGAETKMYYIYDSPGSEEINATLRQSKSRKKIIKFLKNYTTK